jgi:anti-sigma28 factor (negative regulator of flagellin synthesis)
MKVNDPNLSGVQSGAIGRAQETDAVSKLKQRMGVESTSSAGDQVELSNLGMHLRALDSESPERTAYLEKLSADVASGRYKTDAKELSRKIVDDAIKDV